MIFFAIDEGVRARGGQREALKDGKAATRSRSGQTKRFGAVLLNQIDNIIYIIKKK